MSNPTSNFGWQMPTPTDLVTDLPADFEVFGQAVDTDFADLLGGTTGQILSKTSATDLDFTWVNNDQGDITEVTAGTGISGGGTSGTVTVTNSMATAITTAGDLIKGTGSGTFNRLGIGSAGQVLTVSSGAPAWATAASGSMTQLATGSFSSSALSLTSISGAYKSLVLYMNNVYANNQDVDFRFNADSGNNYGWAQMSNDQTAINRTNTTTSFQASYPYIQTSYGPNFFVLTIQDYANTNSWKAPQCMFAGNAANTRNGAWSIGTWSNTAAINAISTRNAMLSGSYTLYGVN